MWAKLRNIFLIMCIWFIPSAVADYASEVQCKKDAINKVDRCMCNLANDVEFYTDANWNEQFESVYKSSLYICASKNCWSYITYGSEHKHSATRAECIKSALINIYHSNRSGDFVAHDKQRGMFYKLIDDVSMFRLTESNYSDGMLNSVFVNKMSYGTYKKNHYNEINKAVVN